MSQRLSLAALAALAVSGGSALADDADALRLADQAPETAARASDWRSFAEVAFGAARQRDGGSLRHDRRLSLDLRYDHALSPEWRAVFADRLDLSWPAQGRVDHAVNTVNEAYLSRQWRQDVLLDLGRVNARHGVATGYNPTDYFRDGALRSVTSIDPASLKENRQGSVMLRGQGLWQGGALTALYSPRLQRQASDAGLSLDWGATNNRERGLIALGQQLTETFSPQFLVYRETALPTQFGLNLSGLANHATVAYLEWSGGRSSALLSQALRQLGPACVCEAWRNRLAGGLTYTTANKLSLTAEWQYNGAGLQREEWLALRNGPPALYALYRTQAQTAQDLPTRQAFFFHATWQDALISRLDLSVMLNIDLVDSSHRAWLEARYRGDHAEYAFQWQRTGGERLSNYAALPDSRAWQLVARHYF